MPAVPLLPVLLSGLFTPSAAAFCGTYVGGAGAELYNSVAQVAVVRMGTRTTLSLSNDVSGDTSRFALVLPVPEVVPEEDVHVLPKTLFQRLDRYSEPRLVRYVCEDFEPSDSGLWDSAGGTDGGDGSDGGGVEVEAEYVVGEYRIVVLSAVESGALFSWLDDNGYDVPSASVPMLQQYIDEGQLFLAAKVDEDAGVGSGEMLSPLQISYTSAAFALPIRIGTLNSKGEQDLIIYGINTYAEGRIGISNYPEVSVEDECLWDPDPGEDFGAFYAERYEEAWAAAGEGAWALEYAWGAAGCDPCTGEPPDLQDLVTLGFDPYGYAGPAAPPNVRDMFFTRLHMRYTPSQATQDLVLYQSGMTDSQQIRYIEYEDYLEDRYPICEVGWAEDPGSCDGGPAGALDDFLDGDDDADAKSGGCGCASGGSAALGLGWALGALALGRRRRSAVEAHG